MILADQWSAVFHQIGGTACPTGEFAVVNLSAGMKTAVSLNMDTFGCSEVEASIVRQGVRLEGGGKSVIYDWSGRAVSHAISPAPRPKR